MKKIFLPIFLFFILATYGQQTINMPSGNGTSERITCNAIFNDQGGTTGNHGINQNSSIKFTPANTGSAIKIVFNSFVVAPGASLTLYDGPDDTYTLINVYDEFLTPTGLPIVASPSPLNPDGSIFIKFVSSTGNEMGWSASITCSSPCQSFNVQLDPLVTTKPIVEEMYMNVCKDSCITFGAEAIFLQNNINYNQTQSNTKFIWRMGFTEPDTMQTITQCYDEVRGWEYLLYAVDTMGCYSNTTFKGRVRVSGNPINGSYPYLTACSNLEFSVNAGYDPMSTINLSSVGSAITGTLSHADTVFLPDGNNNCYNSDIVFDIFDPGQTLNSINHLLGVQLTMEHTFIGDLSIRLICPSGQTVLLKQQNAGVPPLTPGATLGLTCSNTGGGTNLGCADDSGAGSPCYTIPGIGWDYEFRPGATACFGVGGPTVGYSYSSPCGTTYTGPSLKPSVPNSYTNGGPTVAEFYGSYQSLQDLVGCPLNGVWTIMVCDHWSIDNGYIFNWSLSLDQSIIPGGWGYTVGMDTVIWSGPGTVTPTSALSALISSSQVGVNTFTSTVIDEYGCAYDTTFNIEIVQSPIPNINNNIDTARICAGDIVILNANYDDPNAEYWWNTGASTDEIMTLIEGWYSIEITAQAIGSDLICKGNDSIFVSINPTPVPDFEANELNACAPMNLKFTNLTTPTDIPLTYLWRIYNADVQEMYTSTLKDPDFYIETPGKYSVQLIAFTENGCGDSIIKWNYIEVYPNPIAEFSFTPEISLLSETGGVVTFTNYCDSTVFADNPDAVWYWDFADGTQDSSQWNAIHTFDTWGDYNVMFYISTAYGCKSSIKHTVIIEQDLEFPNIITPNNDGFNDVFAIKNLNTDINQEDPDEYRTNTLHIYDRWGKKVYEAENYDTYMKGEQIIVGEKVFSGEKLQDGQYYFSFYYKGKVKTVKYSGSLLIIRDNK